MRSFINSTVEYWHDDEWRIKLQWKFGNFEGFVTKKVAQRAFEERFRVVLRACLCFSRTLMRFSRFRTF